MSNQLIRAAQKAVAALLNVPQVGEVYDQQRSDTHMAAMLDLKTVLADHNFASFEQVMAARAEWASEELEIDEPALVSEADDGYWVQAWVWMEYEE